MYWHIIMYYIFMFYRDFIFYLILKNMYHVTLVIVDSL